MNLVTIVRSGKNEPDEAYTVTASNVSEDQWAKVLGAIGELPVTATTRVEPPTNFADAYRYLVRYHYGDTSKEWSFSTPNEEIEKFFDMLKGMADSDKPVSDRTAETVRDEVRANRSDAEQPLSKEVTK